jgi:hypothetical protein
MLMPTTKRVLYSIHPDVLDRFNALFRGRERSRMIERFMLSAIKERENEVVAAAKIINTDPAFAEYREVSEWADAQAIDTLAHF